MKIIKITNNNYPQALNLAVTVLKKGGVIIYPTETSYGLGGDAEKIKVIKKIFKIKKRKTNKPVSFIISSLVMANKYFKFEDISRQLAKKYWPGPLTLVLPKANKNKKLYADPEGRAKTFGVRISSERLANNLVKKFGRPLVTTSANLSGDQPAYSLSEIVKYFKSKKNQPDLILDCGRLKKVKTSTVAAVVNKKIVILRKGPIKPKI
jgi:L-threonylcarbamoyladenylate synthase